MSKWDMVRLEEVCDILDSLRVPVTASDRKSGIYPYYGANGVQDYVSEYIFDDELVLLAEDGGNFGSKTRPIAYRVSGKCWVNNHAHVLKAKPTIDVDYLCYSIMFYDVSKIISGTTRAKLNQAAMRKMTIPLPPLETQKQIAKTLDTAAELLALRKQQLAELDNLIKSTFYDMFGDPEENRNCWETNLLGDTADIVSGITKGRKTSEANLIPIPYMRVANVQDGRLNLTEIKQIDAVNSEIEKYRLIRGDLLMTEGGDPDKLGRCAIWNEEIPLCIHQNHIFRVRLNQGHVLPQFASFLIGSFYGKKYFLKAAKQTTGIATINSKQLRNFPLLVPDIRLQSKFAEIVTKIEEQKALVQKASDETQHLFDSLMSEYFE